MKTTATAIILAIVLAATFAIAGIKNKTYGTVTVSEITSIYDGDTFRCNIEGYPPIIGERIGIRVKGIDTPEMRDKRPRVKAMARQAKQFAVAMLRNGRHIELRNIKRGKYFRIVADVYIDGKSLGKALLNARLAKPYDGGKKPRW